MGLVTELPPKVVIRPGAGKWRETYKGSANKGYTLYRRCLGLARGNIAPMPPFKGPVDKEGHSCKGENTQGEHRGGAKVNGDGHFKELRSLSWGAGL